MSGISKVKTKDVFFFITAIFLKHFSSQEIYHRFLERDVKIYIDMISVKTAGYNFQCAQLVTCTNNSEEVIKS